MNRVSIAARMTLGLMLITITTLFLAQSAGLVPDTHDLQIKRKVALCETMAITSSIMAQRNEFDSIKTSLRLVADRNPDIASIALRRNSGKVVFTIGDHEKHWKSDFDKPESGSTEQNIFVPILRGNEEWGTVETSFFNNGPSTFNWLRGPFMMLVSFCGLANTALIYLYLRRTLTFLNPSNAVPDRVRTALNTLAEGLVVLDSEQRIVLANQAFADHVEQEPEALQGTSLDDLTWAEELDLESRPWNRTAAHQSSELGARIGMIKPDGSQRVFLVNSSPVVDENGTHRGVLASFDDITVLEKKKVELQDMLSKLRKSRQEIKQRNKELQVLATRDALTGCLNRRSFFETFEAMFNTSRRYEQPLSCIMLDIDHFKSVNDSYGHAAGDEVLRRVSAEVSKSARKSDVVCRYGGEEFCILMPNLKLDGARQAADRIRQLVEAIEFPDLELDQVTISMGVSSIAMKAEDPQGLLEQADIALYAAKHGGRNQVVRWDQMPEGIEEEIESQQSEQDASVVRPRDHEALVPFPAVASLLSALSYRDPDTAAHSVRVANLAVRMGRSLMSIRDSYILEIAALLHDIGKIGVPDRILLKPGPLSMQEWGIMRLHDRVGVDIVGSSFANDQLVDIVRYHHATFAPSEEHGEEMPHGKDIPLGARIVTICDAYDAMVSDRVYRKGRSQAEAFTELRQHAGTQFDPELVELFIGLAGQESPGHQSIVDSKEVALKLGLQLEQLAEAIDTEDIAVIRELSARIESTAMANGVNVIKSTATELRELANEDDSELADIVGLTVELLDMCRAAQRSHVELTDTVGRTAIANLPTLSLPQLPDSPAASS